MSLGWDVSAMCFSKLAHVCDHVVALTPQLGRLQGGVLWVLLVYPHKRLPRKPGCAVPAADPSGPAKVESAPRRFAECQLRDRTLAAIGVAPHRWKHDQTNSCNAPRGLSVDPASLCGMLRESAAKPTAEESKLFGAHCNLRDRESMLRVYFDQWPS